MTTYNGIGINPDQTAGRLIRQRLPEVRQRAEDHPAGQSRRGTLSAGPRPLGVASFCLDFTRRFGEEGRRLALCEGRFSV